MMIQGFNLFLPKRPVHDDDLTVNDPVVCYDNQVTIGNVVADTANALYPGTNLANNNTASRWQANDTTTQYITVTTDNARLIDYVALAKHNLFSSGCTVSIETQSVAAGSWTQRTTPQVPTDDGPLIFRFEPLLLTGVRIKMTGNSVVAYAAVMYVGACTPIPRRLYVGHTPLNLARQANVTNGRAESGNFLGRVVLGEFTSSSATFANLFPHWYRTNLDPFVKQSKDNCFFFAWRPGDYPSETGYAWMTNSPMPQNTGVNGMMSIQFQYGGISQ